MFKLLLTISICIRLGLKTTGQHLEYIPYLEIFNFKKKPYNYTRNINQHNLLDLGTPQTVLKRKLQQQMSSVSLCKNRLQLFSSQIFFQLYKRNTTTIFNNLSFIFLLCRPSNITPRYLSLGVAQPL